MLWEPFSISVGPIDDPLFPLLAFGADAGGEQSTVVVVPQEVPAKEGQ